MNMDEDHPEQLKAWHQDAVREASEKDRHVAHYAVAYAMKQDEKEIIDAGGDAVITKPINARSFSKSITQIIANNNALKNT